MHQLVIGLALVLGFTFNGIATGSENSPYIRYLPGELPLILSSPHGGDEAPEHIPDREHGCWEEGACAFNHACAIKDAERCPVDIVKDKFTQELTMAVRDKIYDLTGRYPHVILNDLHRRKLDANRDLYTAALGVPEMEAAWTEYHRYLYQAKAVVGRGLYCDIHRHSHPTQWVELGYLIPGPNLDSGDFHAGNSSIRNLAANSIDRITFEELLRGPRSFGSFLNQFDYPVVPSPQNPGPGGEPFYSGGYNTRQHGSRTEGEIDAIQIESPWDFVEDDRRDDYADAIAHTMVRYLSEYYGMAYNSGDNVAQTIQLPQMIIFTLISFTLILNYN